MQAKLSYAWVNIGLWSAAILILRQSDCLSMCDCNHACASVLAISERARLCFPGPLLHNCRGEFASKEGEYIRNIYISMLMHLCHSAFTLCALPRSRRPSVNFHPCGRLCDAVMCSTDPHICGPLKLVQFLFPYRRRWCGNMWKRRCAAKSDARWSIFRELSTWFYVHLHNVQMHEILNYLYCWRSVPGTVCKHTIYPTGCLKLMRLQCHGKQD